MSSSYAIQDSINFALPFISNLSLAGINAANEPARTIANLLLGTFYGPPFVWEHNRFTLTETCVVGQTDYTTTVSGSPAVGLSPTFGWVESAYATVQSGNDAGRIFQLGLERSLEKTSDEMRPTKISIFQDNGTNLTFRLFNAPDQAYPWVVTYQGQPTLVSTTANLSTTYWPMPDKYIHIINYGFLAMSLFYLNDPRFPEINTKFIASLLGTQGGLDENVKNLFLAGWMQTLAQQTAIQPKVNQGYQGRGGA
jgi:hypothetical protein